MAKTSIALMSLTAKIERWVNVLLERSVSNTHGFHGGLALEPNKRALNASSDKTIRELPVPNTLTVPLIGYSGTSLIPMVEVGHLVERGQQLAAGLPSPATGTIRSIESHAIIHPGGLYAESIILDCETHNAQVQNTPQTPDSKTSNDKSANKQCIDELLNNTDKILQRAGMVGLGGAAFPTDIKLSGSLNNTRLLIINAAECEPEIACDEALIVSDAISVAKGINVLIKLTQCEQCIVAIENSMPAATNALQAALKAEQSNATLTVIPTIYPTGAESPLIETLTGQQIPHGSIPSKQGIVCINVGTAYALWQSVFNEQALDSRVVSLGGSQMPNPCNVRVRFGTSVSDVLQATNNEPTSRTIRIRAGGPLSGFDLSSLDVPVTAKTNCILAEPEIQDTPAQACIRCGQCADVCPARLQPQQLFWYAQSEDHDKCAQLNLKACIECGCCDLVCPSAIKLTEHFRFAKSSANAILAEQHKAAVAEDKFNEREKRLAKRETAKQARIEERKKAVKTPSKPDADRIKAALSRARNKRKASKK